MNHPMRSRKCVALSAALPLVLVLGGALASAPLARAETKGMATTVAVSPAQLSLECKVDKLVDIRVNDVKDLYGVDVKITFNPNVLEVVDGDAALPGIQIQPGNLPDTTGGLGYIHTNKADNTAGTIEYVAVRKAPAAPQSGSGVVASITFRGKAAGTSPITLAAVVLSNQVAQPLQAELVSGQANVTCAGPTKPPPPQTPVPPKPPEPPKPPLPPQPPVPPKPPAVPPGGCTHVVAPCETLYSIARRYGVTVTELVTLNGIVDPNRIYAGQTLVIPRCAPPVPPVQCMEYVVQPCDTLTSIAARYCESVYAIAVRNGIVNPDCILAGQVIRVCPACGSGKGPSCRTQYVVQPYDTLFGISLQFGVPMQVLADANAIANPHLIYAGQVLCIP